MKQPRPKIGLALAGGAARGIAHLGVLKVLEEYQYPIDYLAGTSMGAIIAGAYAAGLNLSVMEEILRQLRWKDISKFSLSKKSFMSNQPLEDLLHRILPVKEFRQTRIPLGVVAADIQTGEAVILQEGDLAQAIRISCTIPGLFHPLVVHGRSLVDGGLAENLPIKTARALGADCVIGVDVSPKTDLTAPPTNLVEVLMQSFLIIGRHSAVQQAATADLLIEPQASHIRLDEIERVSELIALGEVAMREAMPQALQLLSPVNPTSPIINSWFSWRSASNEID